MARIIGCIGTSHVPTIGVAYDKGKQQDPAWKPLFDGYLPVARSLADQKVDVLVMIYNDHCTSLFFDLYPTFALGIGMEFQVADEGAGLRDLPSIKGDVELQAHVAESLVNDEFDIAVFQDKPIDHGCASPLPLRCAGCRSATPWTSGARSSGTASRRVRASPRAGHSTRSAAAGS